MSVENFAELIKLDMIEPSNREKKTMLDAKRLVLYSRMSLPSLAPAVVVSDKVTKEKDKRTTS